MSRRPNILWYCSDQQRFDTIHAHGNPHINTPNLDRFAASGVSFSHAYCQSPICTPSRASFLTGMYPSALPVNGNGIPRFPSHQAERLIPRRLADSGYDCGLVGKLHLASAYGGREPRVVDGYRFFSYSHAPKGPDLPGHDYADWLRAQGADAIRLMAPNVTKDEYRAGETLSTFAGLLEPTPDRDNVPPELHQTHWCTEQAIAFIEQDRPADQPWMLSVNPFDPHPPFDAPWEYYRRYDPASLPGAHFRESDLPHQRRLAAAGVDFQTRPRDPESFAHRRIQASYYAMIELIDHEFGRLVDHLERTGRLRDTIVIFMSDHGESLGDHGMLLKGCRFFEGLMRVPLMLSWPEHFQRGTRHDGLTALIDLAPTLYDAAGLETPSYVQGRSLFPLLTGAVPERPHRSHVRAEAYNCIDYPDATEATMYREGRWKLNIFHGKDIVELYDLEADPWEHRDLSGDPEVRETRDRLIRSSFDATVGARAPQEPRVAPY